MSKATGPQEPAWYRRTEGVVRREVGGETVLVPAGTGGALELEYLYRLNSVGGVIWQALKEPITLEKLFLKVSEEFDLSALECEDTHARGGFGNSGILRELKGADWLSGGVARRRFPRGGGGPG
jgi:hypothetical protein